MRSDTMLLLDMLIACRKITSYTGNLSEADFRQSDLHQSAILREIQVIGEAARLVSDEYKTQNSNISWRSISGMRNRVIHEYFRVDLELLWLTIQNEIPKLITHLDSLDLPQEDSQSNADNEDM